MLNEKISPIETATANGVPIAKEVKAACKKLGIDITDENGNMRPMADICTDVRAKLKKLSG